MKNYRNKKTIIFLALSLFTLLLAANPLLATGDANEQAQDAGPYHVILETEPESLMANQSATISVIVKDKSTGKPVTGAKVIMDKSIMENNNSSMGSMNMSSDMDKPEETVMHEQSEMSMEPGTYMMEMTFNQSGQWDQAILISSPLGEGKATFPINVGKSGPNYVLIGGVAGAVVLAGLLAAMLRKKKQ